jgi:tRNA(Ile)-lysidine synthase
MLGMPSSRAVHASSDVRGTAVEDLATVVCDALATSPGGRVVLAISGGLDSMVLLDAAARCCREAVAAVATFDHGTGAAARGAADLVARQCARLQLPCIVGRAEPGMGTEAAWREARLRFLRLVADGHGAPIATAHTRDDQVETVFMRVLRGAGTRGLAGLYADSPMVRPLLEVDRQTVARYAATHQVAFRNDPTNRSRRHLRNRVRLDLLPALRRVRPRFDDELLALARSAAAWRSALDAATATLAQIAPAGDELSVASVDLAGYSREALGTLWPAVAGRVGAVLDWRGTERLAEFTITGAVGAVIPLSGGWEVARLRDRLVLRRSRRRQVRREPQALVGDVRHDSWRFRPATTAARTSLWAAALPTDRRLTVREWLPGDRITVRDGGTSRRVKRFFADAGIGGTERAGWPVVLADEEIVWIPGVCRSDVATGRSGRPEVVYICERVHG